jgi:hypothetical protein
LGVQESFFESPTAGGMVLVRLPQNTLQNVCHGEWKKIELKDGENWILVLASYKAFT